MTGPGIYGDYVDPLAPFVNWGWEPPYIYKGESVVPVRSKSGLVTTRHGLVHMESGIAANVFAGSMIRYGARWLCGGSGSVMAILIASAKGMGGICHHCIDAAAPAVYRCFAADGALLYIGSSARSFHRMSAHRTQSPWWPKVANIQTERFSSLMEARIAERQAIRDERPLHNVQLRKRGLASGEVA